MTDFYFDNNYDNLIGGKVAIPDLNKLLNQTYKSKSNTDNSIGNYNLDNQLSTDKTKVYINKNTNEIVIANRGTSDIKDVMSDVKLLFGYKDRRYDEAKSILEKVKQKYPNYPIDSIGHSLGASVAEEIGKDPAVKNIITLNKPTTPKDLINKQKQNDKQYDIRTTGDLVSALAPLQKDKNDIVIPSQNLGILKEHKIDVLDRLPQDLIIGTGKKRLRKKDIKIIINDYIKKNKSKISKNNMKYFKEYLVS